MNKKTILGKRRSISIFVVVIVFVWLMHPVCQVNVPDPSIPIDGYRVTWQTLVDPSGLLEYFGGKRTILFPEGEGYCKSWIGKQFFF